MQHPQILCILYIIIDLTLISKLLLTFQSRFQSVFGMFHKCVKLVFLPTFLQEKNTVLKTTSKCEMKARNLTLPARSHKIWEKFLRQVTRHDDTLWFQINSDLKFTKSGGKWQHIIAKMLDHKNHYKIDQIFTNRHS